MTLKSGFNNTILTPNNKGVSEMRTNYGFWYWFWFSYLLLAYLLIPSAILIVLFVDEINWVLMIKIIWVVPFAIWYGNNKLKAIKKDKINNDNAA